jgi:hypothetical protein
MSLIGTLALIVLLTWQQSRLPELVRISRGLSGDFWYTIETEGRHSGFLHTRSTGLPDGGWRYHSHSHMLLAAKEAVNIRKTLEFEPRPPWRLRYAEQVIQRDSAAAERTRLIRDDEGSLIFDAESQQRVRFDGDYTLADFLKVEQWLREKKPLPGSHIRAPVLQIEGGRVQNTTYTLHARDNSGFTLETHASIGPTITRLTSSLLAESIDVGGVFVFRLADQTEALNVSSPAFRAAYLLPVSARIHSPDSIESMRLTAIDRETNRTLLEIEARRQRLGKSPDSTIPARRIAEERLRTLLRHDAIAPDSFAAADEGERLDRLLTLLRQHIVYREGAEQASLETVLDRGFGECTDFADLLTVLAQHVNLQARTVIGLAYRDRKPFGFAFHAWNEVRIDGTWQVIDPTWDQRFADATHLPLEDQELATLKFYGSGQNVLIEVSDEEYRRI